MFGPMDEVLGTDGLGEFVRGTILRCRSPTGNPLGCLCREGDLSPLSCRATLLKVITQSTSSPANTVDWVKRTETRILLGRFPDMADLAMAAIDAFNYCRRFRIFGCVSLVASAFWSRIWVAVEDWEQVVLSLKHPVRILVLVSLLRRRRGSCGDERFCRRE